MSGVNRMTNGNLAQSKSKGSAFKNALSAFNDASKAKAKQPLKKAVGK